MSPIIQSGAEQKALAGVTKKTYINSQIDWLKQRTIHIYPSCINTIKEIQQWKWKKDKETNQYIDEPVDIFDDAMAALRYGCTSEMQRRTSLLQVL
jgi:phage terminase large subunit